MSKDNLTAVLYKIDDLRLEQRPIPEPKENEVLLEMGCVGICGSDIHYLVNGRIGDFVVNKPMVMGHEASGTVVKLGPGVTSLKIGDRVAIEPGVPCRKCAHCKGGRYNLCAKVIFCATPPVDGNLSRFYAHPEDFCHKLPENVSLEEGALLEPLSVGVHACRKACLAPGSTLLVLGAGPIGLVSLIIAKAIGVSKILVTDVVAHRLEVAKECGADYTLLVEAGKTEFQLASKVRQLLGSQPDATIDCGGFQDTARLALQVTKAGGVLVLVGMGDNEVTVPLINAAIREIDIRGVFRYANDYEVGLSLVSSGQVKVKQLVTHRFPIEETHQAFHVARTGQGNPIKVMIHCNKAAPSE